MVIHRNAYPELRGGLVYSDVPLAAIHVVFMFRYYYRYTSINIFPNRIEYLYILTFIIHRFDDGTLGLFDLDGPFVTRHFMYMID
jgi:hypothetical protein